MKLIEALKEKRVPLEFGNLEQIEAIRKEEARLEAKERACRECDGEAEVDCGHCEGSGRVQCSECKGSGRWDR